MAFLIDCVEGDGSSTPRCYSRNAVASTSSNAAAGVNPSASSVGGPNSNDVERMRLQMLGDPAVMNQLRAVSPTSSSEQATFPPWLTSVRQRVIDASRALRRSYDKPSTIRSIDAARIRTSCRTRAGTKAARGGEPVIRRCLFFGGSFGSRLPICVDLRQLLNSDPYDVDAQRKIEEAIRQQAVLENMEHAMEYAVSCRRGRENVSKMGLGAERQFSGTSRNRLETSSCSVSLSLEGANHRLSLC